MRARRLTEWVVRGVVGGLAIGVLIAAGCGESESAESAPAGRAEVIRHYADGVHASYAASVASATKMDAAIDAFVVAPSDETLAAAKDAWLVARDDYGLTEAFRFVNGPIDNEETGKEGQINAWPLDEAYIDSVEGSPESGIVNTPSILPNISPTGLTALNEKGGETNIATGWHAIEFLLWGQDLSADGPGTRPVTDYTTSPGAKRRGQYLNTVSDLLLADLTELITAWDPDGTGNYRESFLTGPEDDAIRAMLVGMGELSRGELSGERMNVAYTERSQEDEHSCFSDNTTADFVANAKGIRMIYTGEYPGTSGPGLRDLVTDTTLAEELGTALDGSVAQIETIPAPFDKTLRDGVPDTDPGRAAVAASISALDQQADLIVKAGTNIGVTVNLS